MSGRRNFLKMLGVAPVAAAAVLVRPEAHSREAGAFLAIPQRMPYQDYVAYFEGRIVGYARKEELRTVRSHLRADLPKLLAWAKSRFGVSLKDADEISFSFAPDYEMNYPSYRVGQLR